MRRVVITGMGITSPLGSTVKDAFERLKIYKNCVEHWEKLDEYELLWAHLQKDLKFLNTSQEK